jgi:hypothetical protein
VSTVIWLSRKKAMVFTALPFEVLEHILASCDLRQILRCKLVSYVIRGTSGKLYSRPISPQVCKSLFVLISESALLKYCIDLAICGFADDRLRPDYYLNDRRYLLSAARRIWAGSAPATLLETLHVSNLEYWLMQDSVLLRKKLHSQDPAFTRKDNAVVFDISRISSRLVSTESLSHWQIQMPPGTGGILCIDTPQDLLIVRSHEPTNPFYHTHDWYSFSVHSLKTGAPHPRARHSHLRFQMSRRVVKNPHYTRVQVFDNILAVNMASGFQLFTETVFFDWTVGDQKAASETVIFYLSLLTCLPPVLLLPRFISTCMGPSSCPSLRKMLSPTILFVCRTSASNRGVCARR